MAKLIKDFGVFTPYRGAPIGNGMVQMMAQNEQGEDWYQTVAHVPTESIITLIVDPEDGRIHSAQRDPSMLFPASPTGGARVLQIEDEGQELESLWGKHWEAGEIIDAPIPPVLVVTAAQAKVALFRRGLFDQVKAIVDAYPFDVQLWFTDARDWERYNPYVIGIGIELGLTDDEMDELFRYAKTLSA